MISAETGAMDQIRSSREVFFLWNRRVGCYGGSWDWDLIWSEMIKNVLALFMISYLNGNYLSGPGGMINSSYMQWRLNYD
jgi:hypothetical protein